ncbi:hypothetical protein ACEWY4_021394 [Coilia grayii]|uniref:Uncharacterized protein n=1 Tax=Coilia grayii TaxID=363190 RepID=A0ABD1J8V6_9TELE
MAELVSKMEDPTPVVEQKQEEMDELQKKQEAKNARKNKGAALTRKRNKITELMSDPLNMNQVRERFQKYTEMLEEFNDLHKRYQALLSMDERISDTEQWYHPRMKSISDFKTKVHDWMQSCPVQLEKEEEAEGSFKDNVSQRSSRISSGSTESACLVARAEKAALLTKAAALKQRHALELKEEHLMKEKDEVRRQKEILNLETELSATNAQLAVLSDADEHVFSTPLDGMNKYFEEKNVEVVDMGTLQAGTQANMHEYRSVRPKAGAQHLPLRVHPQGDRKGHWLCQETHATVGVPQRPSLLQADGAARRDPGFTQPRFTQFINDSDSVELGTEYRQLADVLVQSHTGGEDQVLLEQQNEQQGPAQESVPSSGLISILNRQNEITSLLLKQQQLSLLPPKNVTSFDGDILQFRSFMTSFEHNIEKKTDNGQDRLFYLEQYTRGQARDLVRSCQHMGGDQGYHTAKRLLHEHFGNAYKMSTAYIEKVLNWPNIKPEDPKALSEFALYLRGCCNVMSNLDYMNELNVASNLKAIVMKLPYKLRDRWRTSVQEKLDEHNRMLSFTELVQFIEKQAKICSNPIFGDIQDTNRNKKSNVSKAVFRPKSSYVTNVITLRNPVDPNTNTDVKPACICCDGSHGLEKCSDLKKKTHREKLNLLKEKGLCFSCLCKGHMSKDCKERLSCNICNQRHPSVLHINFQVKGEASKTEQSQVRKVVANLCGHNGAGNSKWALSILPVQVKSVKDNKIMQTYALLDPGSSATFCTERLVQKLGLHSKPTTVFLRTMAHERPVKSTLVSGLEVSELKSNKFIPLPEVYTQKSMPVTKDNIPTQEDLKKWPYLSGIQLPQIDSDVELLIGMNAANVMEPWQVINSQNDGPYAVRTLLGWVINGPLGGGSRGVDMATVTANRISLIDLQELLVSQYNTEFNERVYEEKSEMSVDDKKFLNIANESVRVKKGHYCINLPFKADVITLPNNRVVAEQRLLNLKGKFKRDPNYKKEYTEFLSDVINKGYAEIVPPAQVKGPDGNVWYIPHHGVYHPKKRTIRVVFDCGASFQGTSLNSELLQGPHLTNTLIGVLTRFRQEPIAMMADIQAMFHQVKVTESHTDFLRFLWWPQGHVDEAPVEYRMTVHLFGATSSPSIANFALRKTAQDNAHNFSPEVTSTVMENFYVDDCLKSVPTEEKAMELMENLTALCHQGGFHLSKWICNSRAVLAAVPPEDRAKEVKALDLDKDQLPMERALGLQWCVQSDAFKFNITISERAHTRRGILSMVSSIFDPLGFLCPLTLPAKLLLQELCRQSFGWDVPIPNTLSEQWTKWINSLTQIADFKVPRCFKAQDFGELVHSQIHHFSDASELGYGTVSYLRMVNAKGQVHVAFLIAKARVAPLKRQTIPRLELAAAALSVKVDRMLQDELQPITDKSVFWSDSTSVLKYIANDHTRFHTYVANRTSRIREATQISQWKYIDTKRNPADDCSRGVSVDRFMRNSSWICGPEFLFSSEDEWPTKAMDRVQLCEDDPEVRKSVTVNVIICNCEEVDKLLNHFSDWLKLRVAVAWILKVKAKLKHLAQKRRGPKEPSRKSQRAAIMTRQSVKVNMKQSVTVEDLKMAERAILLYVQKQCFPEEIGMLQKGASCVKKQSNIYRLDPVLDDGILRVGGRLSRTSMPEERKHPAILPKNHHVSTLILRHIHAQTGHGGRNHILSQVQKQYWIINGNSAARKVVSHCVFCRKNRGKMGEQKMADLPSQRLVADLPPFSNVGLDYFGPFEVRRGRSTLKRYGVIFTCMTSRSVHLEVACSLTTDSCINAIRRFLCRRGQAQHIRSDNGTNLVGAEKELRQALTTLDQRKIHQALRKDGVQWSFNPPTASHHGGFWERLIRMVRHVLCSVLKQQTLDDEGLNTVFCEVETILNSRPITKVSGDPQDIEALTPNHILLLRTNPLLPPGVFSRSDLYHRRRWRQVQYIAELFWKRWLVEYLPLLQERQKWSRPKRNFIPGDIVLMADNTAPRSSWQLGRIVEAKPDVRGHVRVVKLQTKTNILERPVSKVCLLLEGDEGAEAGAEHSNT